MKMGQEMCKVNPDMDGEKMQAIISKKWAVLPEKDKENGGILQKQIHKIGGY